MRQQQRRALTTSCLKLWEEVVPCRFIFSSFYWMLRWLTECNGRTTIAIRGGRTQWLTAALRRRVDLMKNDLQDRCHGVHHHFWFPLKIASTPTHINCSSDNDERPRRWISDKTRHTVARPAVLLAHFTHTLTVIHGGTKQRAICSPCPTSSNSTTIGRIVNVKIVFATIQLQHRCNINFIVRTKVVHMNDKSTASRKQWKDTFHLLAYCKPRCDHSSTRTRFTAGTGCSGS